MWTLQTMPSTLMNEWKVAKEEPESSVSSFSAPMNLIDET